jgi:phosphate starvation-inducible protein PhoH and related proteins
MPKTTRRVTRRDKIESTLEENNIKAIQERSPRAPRRFHIEAKNEKQQRLISSILNKEIVIAIGSAGTGKTYCSTATIANLFLEGKYEKIVLSRTNIGTGKSLGAFPGTIQEKMAPWLLPITSVLEQCFGGTYYKYLLSKNIIEVQPLETIRGRSYKDSLVIVDECQNLTFEEIKAITTRLGENSKMVLCGDPAQSDHNSGKDVLKFVGLCHKHGIDIPIIEFGVDDIVRSDIVANIVRMLAKEKL